MRKGTKIALAASAFVLAGAAGLSSIAIAEYRGSHGGGHHGWGHHSGGHHGWGHRGGRYGKRGGRGWGMHRMMERFDTNEDGKLTQEEVDEARKTLLTKHDADKDGKLSLAEYEKLWLEVKRRRMVRSFQRTDQDGDAAVTIDEFLKPYAKIVERMDRNEDGAIDKEDHRGKSWHRGHRMDRDDDGKPGRGKREG